MSKRGDTSTFDALKRQRLGELDRLIKMPGMPTNEVNMLKTQRKRVKSAKDMNSLRIGSISRKDGGTFKGTF